VATVTYIREKTQTKTAMGKVMNYCKRKDKTLMERDGRKFQLISGKDCCGDTAIQEFMSTKARYGKANGAFFYQYVQSFSPDENITPETAHEIGLKLAEYFKGHEALVATHTDAKHLHTHLVINSVNFENGKKLQMARGSIHKLREFSDGICRDYNLSIVPPKEKTSKSMKTREYRAALNRDSWKLALMATIDAAMKQSRTKAEFIEKMRKQGYGVNWQDSRKYITYETPDDKKCRDNKLHDEKYLKENMEAYYEELGRTESPEHARKPDSELQPDASVLRSAARNAGRTVDAVGANGEIGGGASGNQLGGAKGDLRLDGRANRRGGEKRQMGIGGTAGQADAGACGAEFDAHGAEERLGAENIGNGGGNLAACPAAELAGADLANSLLFLAKTMEDLVNPRDEEKEREQERRRQIRQSRKQRQKSRDEWEMER
jgi:hypothetical protein